MKIGIIGAGSLGSALGERVGRAGHEIMFGGGDAAREVASSMAAGVGSNSDAVEFGDVVVLAVPFAAIEAALDDAAMEGRVLWSCVNALRRDMCSDDPAAKQVVERLVRDLDAHPVDAGKLSAARLVEPAMMLLIGLAYAGAPRDVGLRLLERPAGSGSER